MALAYKCLHNLQLDTTVILSFTFIIEIESMETIINTIFLPIKICISTTGVPTDRLEKKNMLKILL